MGLILFWFLRISFLFCGVWLFVLSWVSIKNHGVCGHACFLMDVVFGLV